MFEFLYGRFELSDFLLVLSQQFAFFLGRHITNFRLAVQQSQTRIESHGQQTWILGKTFMVGPRLLPFFEHSNRLFQLIGIIGSSYGDHRQSIEGVITVNRFLRRRFDVIVEVTSERVVTLQKGKFSLQECPCFRVRRRFFKYAVETVDFLDNFAAAHPRDHGDSNKYIEKQKCCLFR